MYTYHILRMSKSVSKSIETLCSIGVAVWELWLAPGCTASTCSNSHAHLIIIDRVSLLRIRTTVEYKTYKQIVEVVLEVTTKAFETNSKFRHRKLRNYKEVDATIGKHCTQSGICFYLYSNKRPKKVPFACHGAS